MAVTVPRLLVIHSVIHKPMKAPASRTMMKAPEHKLTEPGAMCLVLIHHLRKETIQFKPYEVIHSLFKIPKKIILVIE